MPGEALDQGQAAARARAAVERVGVDLVAEVRGLDDEGVALPSAAASRPSTGGSGRPPGGPPSRGMMRGSWIISCSITTYPGVCRTEEVVVVAAGALGGAAGDAALGHGAAGPTVAVAGPARPGLPGGGARRQAAVGRVDDERRSGEGGAALPPEVVVGAGVAGRGRTVVAADVGGVDGRDLLVGVHGPARHALRALEGGGGRVRPQALQVGLAVGGARAPSSRPGRGRRRAPRGPPRATMERDAVASCGPPETVVAVDGCRFGDLRIEPEQPRRVLPDHHVDVRVADALGAQPVHEGVQAVGVQRVPRLAQIGREQEVPGAVGRG